MVTACATHPPVHDAAGASMRSRALSDLQARPASLYSVAGGWWMVDGVRFAGAFLPTFHFRLPTFFSISALEQYPGPCDHQQRVERGDEVVEHRAESALQRAVIVTNRRRLEDVE